MAYRYDDTGYRADKHEFAYDDDLKPHTIHLPGHDMSDADAISAGVVPVLRAGDTGGAVLAPARDRGGEVPGAVRVPVPVQVVPWTGGGARVGAGVDGAGLVLPWAGDRGAGEAAAPQDAGPDRHRDRQVLVRSADRAGGGPCRALGVTGGCAGAYADVPRPGRPGHPGRDR